MQKKRQGFPQPIIHVGFGTPGTQEVVRVLRLGSGVVVVQGNGGGVIVDVMGPTIIVELPEVWVG